VRKSWSSQGQSEDRREKGRRATRKHVKKRGQLEQSGERAEITKGSRKIRTRNGVCDKAARKEKKRERRTANAGATGENAITLRKKETMRVEGKSIK